MHTARSAVTVSVLSSPQRPWPVRSVANGAEVRPSEGS